MIFTSLDFLSSDEIQQQQFTLLKTQLLYLQQHSPYYQKIFAQQQYSIADFSCMEDLQKLPFTTKEIFHENCDAFLCHPRVADYSSTSGTTGNPVTVALSEHDLERLAYNETQSFRTMGASDTDIFQLLLTLDKQFMAGMAYSLGIRALGAGMVRVGPGQLAQQWELMQRLQSTVLIAVPSFIIRLLDYAKVNGINPAATHVQKILCIGEAIRGNDFAPNALAKRITEQWPVQLFSTYASTEMQTAFTECPYEKGGHLRAELLVAEIIDDQGRVLGDGETGELVITHLGVQAMPLLRYRTGDLASLHYETCACGRNTPRISAIKGRKNQLIKYKGTTLYPAGISEALAEVYAVQDYIIEITKDSLGLDGLRLLIVENGHTDSTENQLRQVLQARLRVLPEIRFVSARQLQEMRPTDARKPVMVIVR